METHIVWTGPRKTEKMGGREEGGLKDTMKSMFSKIAHQEAGKDFCIMKTMLGVKTAATKDLRDAMLYPDIRLSQKCEKDSTFVWKNGSGSVFACNMPASPSPNTSKLTWTKCTLTTLQLSAWVRLPIRQLLRAE